MRLICPNCDAQYEVADDVIPTSGRDVQCSNCGHVWFEHRKEHTPRDASETAAADVEHDAPTGDQDGPGPVRRELDPKVADILREEAALESKARARSAAPLESQPDLGLDAAAPVEVRPASTAQPFVRDEIAKRETATSPSTPDPAPRRDRLPDIEDINSTLRTADATGLDPVPDDALAYNPPPEGGSGFRRGFSLMLVLAACLISVYALAPQIAQSMPQADPYLSAYVAQVDTARTWLDARVSVVLSWLDAVASGTGDST